MIDETVYETYKLHCLYLHINYRELGVPVVLDPEYLASPHLDELSGMTYISYFMRENGPGYKATMNWVRNQLPERHISNFTVSLQNCLVGLPMKLSRNLLPAKNSMPNIIHCFVF